MTPPAESYWQVLLRELGDFRYLLFLYRYVIATP